MPKKNDQRYYVGPNDPWKVIPEEYTKWHAVQFSYNVHYLDRRNDKFDEELFFWLTDNISGEAVIGRGHFQEYVVYTVYLTSQNDALAVKLMYGDGTCDEEP